METVGERIRAMRAEKHISAAELARRADISKGYLSEIETGEASRPSAEVLFRIARELGTSMAVLLGKRSAMPTSRPLPAPLKEFAMNENLPPEDVDMLAKIRFRGEQPKTVQDWRFLYDAIKRSIR